MAEEIQSRDECDEQLQGILLDAKVPLEKLVARGGRRLDAVLAARLTDFASRTTRTAEVRAQSRYPYKA
jgi:hypothetical protein